MGNVTSRSALLMVGAGLLIAFLAGAEAGPRTAGVWLGVAVAVIGFIAWQVVARREARDRRD